MPALDTRTYRSRRHPRDRPWALVFAQDTLRPLAILMLPLMIATLVAALKAGNLLPFVVWGYPSVILLSVVWTTFNLERLVAEITLLDDFVVVRSVADCARQRATPPRPLYDARDYGQWLVLAAGDRDVVVHRDDWPEFQELRTDLRARFYPDVP
jgi:hypothetical protein